MLWSSDLVATGLVEKDSNGEVLWTWSYPYMSCIQRELIVKKFSLELEAAGVRTNPLVLGRFASCWYYMNTTDVIYSDRLPRVKQFVLVVWAREFNPEKYEALCQVLSKIYSKTGDPASLLEAYLSVFTLGSCTTQENGTFFVRDFDQTKSFALSCIKNVINIFKLETILIYTALLLKKRIIVYHHRLSNLQKFVRALPAFVWHRQNWNIVYPYQDITKSELEDLKSCPAYVAGFLDTAIETRSDLYDVFVNLAAVEITVAPHAKETFTMSKTHKDIALAMVHLAEDASTNDEQVIKEIATKTASLINGLLSFADENQTLTLESLKRRKLAPAVENFLFNLAVAENLIHL